MKSMPSVRLISEADNGIYDALNKGMRKAKGDIIGIVYPDDFLADAHVLEKVLYAFVDPAIDTVYGDLDYVAANNPSRVVRHWSAGVFSSKKLQHGWMPPHPTLFIRKRVVEELGGYDTNCQIAADYDAILRWFGKGGITSAYIPEVLVKMKIGGESNLSLERVWRKKKEDYKALRTNHVGGLKALLCKNLSKLPQFLRR